MKHFIYKNAYWAAGIIIAFISTMWSFATRNYNEGLTWILITFLEALILVQDYELALCKKELARRKL